MPLYRTYKREIIVKDMKEFREIERMLDEVISNIPELEDEIET